MVMLNQILARPNMIQALKRVEVNKGSHGVDMMPVQTLRQHILENWASNTPAENAIRPNVIGRKNWLFSVSEAGVKANAICLSLAETAKVNGINFYQYLVTLMTKLPNLPTHQQLLNNYMPWSKKIQATYAK